MSFTSASVPRIGRICPDMRAVAGQPGKHWPRDGRCRPEGAGPMTDAGPQRDGPDADELLRRALLDDEDSAAVSLRVTGVPVIFHGRRDLGTIQTYVARGALGAGDRVGPDDLLRVPCDLDLADAGDRDDAERMYVEQARTLRDSLVGADTVLDVWREPLRDMAGDVKVERSVRLDVRLPAHRLLPTALVAADRGLIVV